MKKVKVKLVITILLAILVGVMSVFTVSAAEKTVYSGTCGADGDNLKWTLDTDTGKLVISGSGAMGTRFLTGETEWGLSLDVYVETITIANGVTSISDYAFHSCSSLESVTIPNSVTSIGEGAFVGCYALKSVTIPNNVTSIGDGAFNSCYNLKSVTIPNSVTSIGKGAFFGCTKLTSVTISDNVTSIGDGAFGNCYMLDFTTYENANYLGNGDNPYLCLYEATDTSVTSVSVNSKTKIIVGTAFSDCSKLTDVTIPDSVTSIGETLFENCKTLKNITYCGTEAEWQEMMPQMPTDVSVNYHKWNEGVITVEPTEDAEGVKNYTCSECGEVKEETLKKLSEDVIVILSNTTENSYDEVSEDSGCTSYLGGGESIILLVSALVSTTLRKKKIK